MNPRDLKSISLLISYITIYFAVSILGFSDSSSAQSTLLPFENSQNNSVLSLEERHSWERHVRTFRREHNFAFSIGSSNGTWDVGEFGSLTDRQYDNSGLFSRFQYSFHIQLYKGFGYFLGSSMGYHYESTDARHPFKPAPSIMLPGLLVGLTYNISPAIRMSASMDAYLERYSDLEERDGRYTDMSNCVDDEGNDIEDCEGEIFDPEITVTMQTYDRGYHASWYMDVFYNLYWAVRLEAHARKATFIKPHNSEDVEAIDARISKTDRWLGVGLLYHLL